jgi:hypothetical protein
MLVFKKEDGFPMSIMIETTDHKEFMDNNEIWEGYMSVVLDENNNVIDEFTHGNLTDRVNWVNGFMAGIKYKEKGSLDKKIDELFNTPEPWSGTEIPLLNDDGTSNMEVGDWVVTKDGKVRKIEMDNQEDLPFEMIERFATAMEIENAEEINDLIEDLRRERIYNKSLWNTYGSELCSADMSRREQAFLSEIKRLRNENL